MSTISLAVSARRWTPLISVEDVDTGFAIAFTSITAPGFAFIPREHLLTIRCDG